MRIRTAAPSPFHSTVTLRLPGRSNATAYTCQLGVNEFGSSGQAAQRLVCLVNGAKLALRKPEIECTAVRSALATGRTEPPSRVIPHTADWLHGLSSTIW